MPLLLCMQTSGAAVPFVKFKLRYVLSLVGGIALNHGKLYHLDFMSGRLQAIKDHMEGGATYILKPLA